MSKLYIFALNDLISVFKLHANSSSTFLHELSDWYEEDSINKKSSALC